MREARTTIRNFSMGIIFLPQKYFLFPACGRQALPPGEGSFWRIIVNQIKGQG
jgi:hypothetical protein